MTTLGDKIITRMEAFTTQLENGVGMPTSQDNLMLHMDSTETTTGDQIIYNNWEELAVAVNNWSMANFGSQSGLGLLMPLLGIVEEVGEYDEALTLEDKEDAIGDILIFALDYAKRAGMNLSDIPIRSKQISYCTGKWVSKLAHARLKRFQKIRGMDNITAFREKEKEAILGLFGACDGLSDTMLSDGAFKIACKTWTEVVAKRKWHTQPDKPITFESSCEDFKNVAAELNWGIS